jgi:hypothetical protein
MLDKSVEPHRPVFNTKQIGGGSDFDLAVIECEYHSPSACTTRDRFEGIGIIG